MIFRESPQILCGSCSESVVVDEFDIFILVHAVQACRVLQIFIERLEITGITDFGEVKHRVVIAADIEMVAVCEQVTCAGFFLAKSEFVFGTFGCVSDDWCPVPGSVGFRITAVYGESLFVIDACCGICLAIQYWVGEDIRKAEEEKRGTWLFTLGFIGLTVLTMLAANIPGQVQQDQYLYLTKEHTEQLEKVLLREATADSERCIQWYEKQMLGIRNNKALGNPAMQTEDERQYKNRIDGKEVYRDPDTCTLRVKELKDGSTKDSVLINGPVGEIIAMRERIFYIDMEDHNVLKSVTYDGRKRKTWMKDPVKQFAVIGGYVICCTEDEKLIRCDMSTGKKKELADHIQYFFAGAKLYAQKGSKIVSVSYDGKEIRVFKKDVVMMDKKEDKVYYRRMDRKKEQMYVCDVDGGMEKMVGSRD